MTTTDDYITEYGNTISQLQEENNALKQMLRRYITFGNADLPGNLYNADLTESLRKAENMYQSLFSSMQVPAFEGMLMDSDCGDPDFVFSNTNQRFAQHMGMEPRDIIGKSFRELNLMESPSWIEAVLAACKTLDTTEMEIQEGDDALKLSVTGISHGSFVAHYVSDTGAYACRRSNDQTRNLKIKQMLAESEDRYKTLFNSICQPIIVVDCDGNIVMLNTTAVELFEEDDSSLMDNSVQIIPALSLINMDHVRQVHDTGTPVSYRASIRKNGQERWYYCTMQLIRDFFGEKVVQIISNDITDIKHYQAEILMQKKQAEESNHLKTIFLSNIAHETRTPANIISGLSQMIKSGINPGKHAEYVTDIERNCQKLLEIIDDISQLSQIESGQIKIRHEICSINSIVEEAHQYLNGKVDDSGKQIATACSPGMDEHTSLIYADSLYINQVFRKLISNAVTFTDSGSIEVGAVIEAPNVTFYVSDTGIGIPRDKQSLIFERFRQVDEGASRQYGGTGLGLPIANELTTRMGGSIKVDSNLNEGSRFSFSIPYHKAELQQ